MLGDSGPSTLLSRDLSPDSRALELVVDGTLGALVQAFNQAPVLSGARLSLLDDVAGAFVLKLCFVFSCQARGLFALGAANVLEPGCSWSELWAHFRQLRLHRLDSLGGKNLLFRAADESLAESFSLPPRALNEVLESFHEICLLDQRSELLGDLYQSLRGKSFARTEDASLLLKARRGRPLCLSLKELKAFAKEGRSFLIEQLKRRTGRLPRTLSKALNKPRKLSGWSLEGSLEERIQPFSGLLFGREQKDAVLLSEYHLQHSAPHSLHYTPRQISAFLVAPSLRPYLEAAESVPLICDPAMGAGALLIQAHQFFAQQRPDFARELLDRGLYGLDIDATAVDISKLSLWLQGREPERSWTFADDRLRCGDALLGLTEAEQFTRGDVRQQEPIKERLKQSFEDFCQEPTKAARAEVRQLADEILAKVAPESFIEGRSFHWCLEFPKVFLDNGGFDIVLGNPPFHGGRRIRSRLGQQTWDWLNSGVFDIGARGDMAAYFLTRAVELLHDDGRSSFVVPNSLSDSVSSERGSTALLSEAWRIYHCERDIPWPAAANVTVSLIHLEKRAIGSPSNVSRCLESSPALGKKARRRRELCSQGMTLGGRGFIVDRDQYRIFIEHDERNSEVLKPYINGRLLNGAWPREGSLYAIDFRGLNRRQAATFEAPFHWIEQHVKPYRESLTRQLHETRYWLFWDDRNKFYRSLAGVPKLLALSRVSKYLQLDFVRKDWVHSDALKLFALTDASSLLLLQSSFHEVWAETYGSRLRAHMRYTSKVFSSFPWPETLVGIEPLANRFLALREAFMKSKNRGLTAFGNEFHDSRQGSQLFVQARQLFAAIDRQLSNLYGWPNLVLTHNFYRTQHGPRYTVHAEAKDEIRRRLHQIEQS